MDFSLPADPTVVGSESEDDFDLEIDIEPPSDNALRVERGLPRAFLSPQARERSVPRRPRGGGGARYAASAPPPPAQRRRTPTAVPVPQPQDASEHEDLSAVFGSSDPLAFGQELGVDDVPAVSLAPEFDPWDDLSDPNPQDNPQSLSTREMPSISLPSSLLDGDENSDILVDEGPGSGLEDLAQLGFEARDLSADFEHGIEGLEVGDDFDLLGELTADVSDIDIGSIDMGSPQPRFPPVSLDIDVPGGESTEAPRAPVPRRPSMSERIDAMMADQTSGPGTSSDDQTPPVFTAPQNPNISSMAETVERPVVTHGIAPASPSDSTLGEVIDALDALDVGLGRAVLDVDSDTHTVDVSRSYPQRPVRTLAASQSNGPPEREGGLADAFALALPEQNVEETPADLFFADPGPPSSVGVPDGIDMAEAASQPEPDRMSLAAIQAQIRAQNAQGAQEFDDLDDEFEDELSGALDDVDILLPEWTDDPSKTTPSRPKSALSDANGAVTALSHRSLSSGTNPNDKTAVAFDTPKNTAPDGAVAELLAALEAAPEPAPVPAKENVLQARQDEPESLSAAPEPPKDSDAHGLKARSDATPPLKAEPKDEHSEGAPSAAAPIEVRSPVEQPRQTGSWMARRAKVSKPKARKATRTTRTLRNAHRPSNHPLADYETNQPLSEDPGVLMRHARALRRERRYEEAQKVINKLVKVADDNREARQLANLNQETLETRYLQILGDMSNKPRMAVSPAELMDMEIDSRGGYLLSMVDGSISFQDLMELSPMSSFETLKMFCVFVKRGILLVPSNSRPLSRRGRKSKD